MNIGILGTGTTGATIGAKLVELGHSVCMGGRAANNEKAKAWAAKHGANASCGTFERAAEFGDIAFLCVVGSAALEALRLAKHDNLKSKILIDITNPLNFSSSPMPSLYVSGGEDSLGEQIQRAIPAARVVKALNTVTAEIMVNPAKLQGAHDIFIAGNDTSAKTKTTEILKEWFGWQSVIDLGDIAGARATEGYLLLWLRLWGTLGTGNFNISVVR